MVAKYGASGVEGDVPSFKGHMATAEGQAELGAFVQRVDARVQQDWDKLPPHLRGGALRVMRVRVSAILVVRSSTCISFLRAIKYGD